MNSQNNVIGQVRSSLDYVKTEFKSKKYNSDVKAGINSMVENFNYHLNKQSDQEFLAFLVQYHDTQERNLKNIQGFDKKLNRQSTGKLIVLKRLGAILK